MKLHNRVFCGGVASPFECLHAIAVSRRYGSTKTRSTHTEGMSSWKKFNFYGPQIILFFQSEITAAGLLSQKLFFRPVFLISVTETRCRTEVWQILSRVVVQYSFFEYDISVRMYACFNLSLSLQIVQKNYISMQTPTSWTLWQRTDQDWLTNGLGDWLDWIISGIWMSGDGVANNDNDIR